MAAKRFGSDSVSAARSTVCSNPSVTRPYWLRCRVFSSPSDPTALCLQRDGGYKMHQHVGVDVAGSPAMLDVTPVVYIVDDDISVREALEGLVQEAGWRPTVFSSARDFLVHPRNAGPSCLVLDVSL